MDSKKSNKISDIVRFQQILKKWRKFAKTSKDSRSNNDGVSSSTSSSRSRKFLKRTLSLSDNSIREAQNNVVPKGFLAVCVGEELKRFVIPTEYLGHHVFHALLREAEEEFGFQQTGVLRFPCEVSLFENILKMVEQKKDVFLTQECRLSFEEMVGCCSSESPLIHSHHIQSPMCR